MTSYLTINFTATLRGAVGNSFTLAAAMSSPPILGGANFSGGADYPTGLLNLQTGQNVFDIAADHWDSDHTNAMRVIDECTQSERGRFWIGSDGMINFENKLQVFKTTTAASVISLHQDYFSTVANQDVDDVYNRIEVQYTPRGFLVIGGVVAKYNTYVQVPGTTIGNDRWNPTQGIPKATAFLKLPFTDPATQLPIGARNVVTPLAAGTDYFVHDAVDANGNGINADYTNSSRIAATAAINGSNVELTFTNSALGPLYITGLQVRGDGITSYNPATAIAEDAASQSKHQKRLLPVSIPLNSTKNFMDGLASYLLLRFKDQRFRVKHIDTNNLDSSHLTPDGGLNLFGIKIGDAMTITDEALSVVAQKVRVCGIGFEFNTDGTVKLSWDVFALDTTTYWLLEDATYGKLDQTTTLAL